MARSWSSSRLSCGERLHLRCDGKAGNSFPTTQEKDPSSGARRRKRGSSGCGRDSRSSSRVETGMSGNFLSCSSSVALPFAWIKGSVTFPRGFPTRLSHEAFPRGFPTGLFHVPPWCESILGLKVEAVQGKQVSLERTETSGGLWECGTILEFLSPFLWRAPPLEMQRDRGEFFPDHAGKGSLLSG